LVTIRDRQAFSLPIGLFRVGIMVTKKEYVALARRYNEQRNINDSLKKEIKEIMNHINNHINSTNKGDKQ
jgi:hypothetical protein